MLHTQPFDIFFPSYGRVLKKEDGGRHEQVHRQIRRHPGGTVPFGGAIRLRGAGTPLRKGREGHGVQGDGKPILRGGRLPGRFRFRLDEAGRLAGAGEVRPLGLRHRQELRQGGGNPLQEHLRRDQLASFGEHGGFGSPRRKGGTADGSAGGFGNAQR